MRENERRKSSLALPMSPDEAALGLFHALHDTMWFETCQAERRSNSLGASKSLMLVCEGSR